MIVSKTTPLNLIEIWQPRYKDRKVLIATYKVKEHNKIVFTKARHLKTKEFYISGKEIRNCSLSTNGTISVYEVPMDKLEQIDYKENQ